MPKSKPFYLQKMNILNIFKALIRLRYSIYIISTSLIKNLKKQNKEQRTFIDYTSHFVSQSTNKFYL